MENIILMTKADLEALLQKTLSGALNNFQTPQSEDQLMTIKEAAAYLQLSQNTLYGFTSRRVIPFIKRGKMIYFRKSELNAWLEEGRRRTIKQFQG